MSVQPNEALREARARIAELKAELEKLRERSPRTKIEGVECECERLPAGVRAEGADWLVIGHAFGGWVDIEVGDGEMRVSPDEGELIASKLHWCARAARGEDV